MFVLLTHDLSYRGTFILNVAIMGEYITKLSIWICYFPTKTTFLETLKLQMWHSSRVAFVQVLISSSPVLGGSARKICIQKESWGEKLTGSLHSQSLNKCFLRHLFGLFRNECLGVFKWGDESFSIKSKALYINPLFIAFVKLAVFKIYKRNGSYNKSTSIVGIKMNKGKFNRDF